MATWETTTHRLIRFAKLIADCLRCRRPHWLDPAGIVAGSQEHKMPTVYLDHRGGEHSSLRRIVPVETAIINN